MFIFFQGPASAASMMPTAAAVAAAAATAKIQAMDAVASNAVALGKCGVTRSELDAGKYIGICS